MRLCQADFDALQRVILDLYHPRDLPAFRRAATRNVLEIIPARHVLFVESRVDLATRRARVVDLWESSPRLVPELVTRMVRAGLGHPFAKYSLRSSDPAAIRSFDVFSVRQFDDADQHEEFHRQAGVPRRFGATWLDGSALATLNVIRRSHDPDFSRRDRRVLELLLPHFVLACRNAQRVARRGEWGALSRNASGLTPREVQVAQQLALGRTNPEIGLVLHVRVRTVEKHVENILIKLGVENRTAAALIIAESERVASSS